MCTVSFIGGPNGFTLISNRDEKSSRKTLLPAHYIINNKSILFPKDETANGTWIALGANGKTACLLNGAFNNHKRELPYDRSRGLILLESFSYATHTEYLEQVNLSNVEPFTLILVGQFAQENNSRTLFELKWDGIKKHIQELNSEENHIWSSSTLYPAAIAKKKESWFRKWIQSNKEKINNNIFEFHNRKHSSVKNEDVLSDFGAGLKTISITSVSVQNDAAHMHYTDLVKNTDVSVPFKTASFENA